MNATFFQELLSSIAERGRSLLDRRAGDGAGHAALLASCEALLSSRGEASGVAIAGEILAHYAGLQEAEQVAFLTALAGQFGPDADTLARATRDYLESPSQRNARAVHHAAESRRQELIRRLNLAPGGTAALVAMRADVLRHRPGHPALADLDEDFAHLFASWFNRGFLVMRRVDWSTPAAILAKIIEYEAVHEIAGWDDLRRRIEPPDRRCFAFFHPALVDEPLIFVEVALTRDVPASIGDLLSAEREIIAPAEAQTATFYSISNCQKGLRGISFGNFLIKQVAEDLAKDAASLKTFVTLSPVPGFRNWVEALRGDEESGMAAKDREALAVLDEPGWHADAAKAETAKRALMPLAARYFLAAKDRSERPLDPVARFHLGNGARLERIDWLADTSAKGLAQSFGLMVNYLYRLDEIERNHEAYANAGEVAASAQVRRLLPADTTPRTQAPAHA